MPDHSSRSSKSRTKSIRFPNQVWDEVEAYAKRHDMTFNEVCIARIVAMRDRRWAAPVDSRQQSIFDAIAEGRAAEQADAGASAGEGNRA